MNQISRGELFFVQTDKFLRNLYGLILQSNGVLGRTVLGTPLAWYQVQIKFDNLSKFVLGKYFLNILEKVSQTMLIVPFSSERGMF